MNLAFTKMQGAGNDFILLDGITQKINLTQNLIRFLADRHYGIGADQVLVVEASAEEGVDFRYRIFNADGNEVEQCGNGARCFALYVNRQKLTSKKQLKIRTMKGIIETKLADNGEVTVNMGSPVFTPSDIPFLDQGLSKITRHRDTLFNVPAQGAMNWLSVVNVGNPHAVIFVGKAKEANLEQIGPNIERHCAFPEGVNVEFLEIVNSKEINLRVWERGAGETLACGSGACAAAVVGMRRGVLESNVKVNLPGATLEVSWNGENDAPVLLKGPAELVFSGSIVVQEIKR